MNLIGASGGFFVVSLNSLLQARGHESLGAGHAIAVQNLTENSAMLVMLGLYAMAMRSGAPVSAIAAGFGACICVGVAALWIHRIHSRILDR
jgi:LPLT family lysophospholipid transporter-like MFS transporter